MNSNFNHAYIFIGFTHHYKPYIKIIYQNMRYRLRFQVDHEFGSLLPLNYQLEVAKFIRHMLTEDRTLYDKWLESNHIVETKKTQLFNFSNLIVLDRKIYGDRLLIMSDNIELTISFYHEEQTDNLIARAFDQLVFTIGDKKSSIRLKVVGIEKLPAPQIGNQMLFVARSPIVVQTYSESKYLKFLQPTEPNYTDLLISNLLEKYELFNGSPLQNQNFYTTLNILTEPKSKLLGINGLKKEFIKGYLFRFSLKAPKELLRIGYHVGFGDRNHFGFGFCDILYKEPCNLSPILKPDDQQDFNSIIPLEDKFWLNE